MPIVAVQPAAVQSPLPTVVRVAASPDDGVIPVLYAERSGLLSAAGVDVQVQKLNSGSAVAAAVAGGAVEIGRPSMLPMIGGHARGLPFVLVAASTMHVPGDPDSAISWLATKVWLDATG